MSTFRSIFLTVVIVALLFECTCAGPASRFALAIRSNNKIPRTIRAPFRNSEMMTARGFGKRSLMPKFVKDNEYSGTNQWSFGKHDGKFLEELPTENAETIEQILNEQPESISIDWFANEMASNPQLIKAILHHFVDTDKDGFLTQHELLAFNPTTQDTNELY